jgi:hypothetical protein
MDTTTTIARPSREITDLFDLDARTAPVAKLPTVGRSANCTNDGCTGSCVTCSCGCR